jgi:hypothetical protein
MSVFGATREEAMMFLPQIIGEPPITLRAMRDVRVAGEVATAVVETAFGIVLETTLDTLVREEGAWKLHDEVALFTPFPAGVRIVPVETRDFSFALDRAAASVGNIAFDVTNTGQQPHEVLVARIPAGLNLAQAVQLPEPPAGVEVLGGIFIEEPGGRQSLVFTEPLRAGRYALLCFVEDPASGLPHAVLGMFAEFTVGPVGVPTGILPPATGDAGLVAERGAWVSLTALVLVALSSGASLALALRRA